MNMCVGIVIMLLYSIGDYEQGLNVMYSQLCITMIDQKVQKTRYIYTDLMCVIYFLFCRLARRTNTKSVLHIKDNHAHFKME